jgi:hypothetical protein
LSEAADLRIASDNLSGRHPLTDPAFVYTVIKNCIAFRSWPLLSVKLEMIGHERKGKGICETGLECVADVT